jgi:hypothetical protein
MGLFLFFEAFSFQIAPYETQENIRKLKISSKSK